MRDQDFEVVDITETAYYAIGFYYTHVSVLCSCGYSYTPNYYYIYLN